MSWFGRIAARLGFGSDDSTALVRVIQGPTAAGVPVPTADTVLKNATAWACVTYLARTVGQLPWRVMQDRGDAAPRRSPMHPVQRLLQTRPNPEMSSFAFRETMVGWACRYGNAVAEIQHDNRGVPIALWQQHPTRVAFERDTATGELLYVINAGNGDRRVLTAWQVFHVRGFGEGVVGLDVVSYAAESLGWAQATELFGASLFGNGLNASGFLYVPGKLSKEGKTAIENEIKEKHGGPRRGNKVMILDGNLKFEKAAAVDPEDAQFIETRQHQVEEICRWFGVPPHKVMHMLRSTFSNIEHQSIEVVVDSITPWALRFEQEADYKLFGGNRGGFFTKMDLKGLLRGDFKSRQEGLQLMRRNGVLNANEWRRLEDMDEIGPDGDKYTIEGNMTTLERLGEEPVKPQAPDVAAPADDADDAPPPESPVQRARQQMQRALLH
jgi:HK97 family phage portal protein